MTRLPRLFLPAVFGFVLTGCATASHWNVATDYMKVSINSNGYITGIKNTTVKPVREFAAADKPSPVLSLYNSERDTYYMPVNARFRKREGSILLEYPNGSVAEVTVNQKGKYIRLTLTDLKNREEIDAVQWGSVHTNITNLLGEIIGVARDTSETVNYSIGMLALDENTLGGTADLQGDAAPFEYIIHTPDAHRFPLPDHLHEGQHFSLGGDGVSDVAFYANKEPYYRIMYGNAATVDSLGRISVSYQSRDRRGRREVLYSLIPHMPANVPNHLQVEPVPGVDYIGSSVALWGSPDSTALMDVIRTIVLEEGLPYPTVRGKWIKDPSAYSPDVLSVGGKYDSIIDYTVRLGFPAIYAHDRGFLHPDRANHGYLDGKDESRKPFHFTNGNKSHREFAALAAKQGIMIGRDCITNALAPETSDVTPVPSDSLCHQQLRVLMNDLTPTDTSIVIDDPTYMDEVGSWEGHCPSLNMVKIGGELIHYLGVSKTAPYRLLNVTRGYWGTQPSAHVKGDAVEKLQVTINYGYDGIIPNLALQDKIAEHYADVAARSGVTMYDFDGQEFLFNNGHGYYSVKRFFRRMFERAKMLGVPYLRFSGATLSEGSWHYQSVWNVGGGKNLYDLDTREWGSTTSQGKDMRDVTFSNYFPVSFGNNFAIKASSTAEQYEHIEALCVGYGATYFLPLSENDVESCPQKDRIFRVIRTWEEARRADAFPNSVKKLLRDSSYDWHLEPGDTCNCWTLHRLERGEIKESFHLMGKPLAEGIVQ